MPAFCIQNVASMESIDGSPERMDALRAAVGEAGAEWVVDPEKTGGAAYFRKARGGRPYLAEKRCVRCFASEKPHSSAMRASGYFVVFTR